MFTPENYQDSKEYNAFMELFDDLAIPRTILSYELFIALYEFSLHFIKKLEHDTRSLKIKNSEDLLKIISLSDLFDPENEITKHALGEIKRYLRFEIHNRQYRYGEPIYNGFNDDRPFNIKRRIIFVILEYILAEIFEFLPRNEVDVDEVDFVPTFITLNDLMEVLNGDEELNSIFRVLKVDKRVKLLLKQYKYHNSESDERRYIPDDILDTIFEF